MHCCFQAKKQDKWEDVVCAVDLDRHYYLYAFLDGTRGHEPLPRVWNNQFSGRGFPKDFEIVEDGDTIHHRIKCPEIRGYRQKYYEDEDWDVNDPEHLLMWMGEWGANHIFGNEILDTAKLLNEEQMKHLKYFIDEVERLVDTEGAGDPENIRFVYGYDN